MVGPRNTASIWIGQTVSIWFDSNMQVPQPRLKAHLAQISPFITYMWTQTACGLALLPWCSFPCATWPCTRWLSHPRAAICIRNQWIEGGLEKQISDFKKNKNLRTPSLWWFRLPIVSDLDPSKSSVYLNLIIPLFVSAAAHKSRFQCWAAKLAQGSCLPHLKLTFVIHRGASAAGT